MTDGGRMARIADLLKIIKVIKGIGAVMLAARIITGLVEIMSALKGKWRAGQSIQKACGS